MVGIASHNLSRESEKICTVKLAHVEYETRVILEIGGVIDQKYDDSWDYTDL